jgi:hypothetical protein
MLKQNRFSIAIAVERVVIERGMRMRKIFPPVA